MPVLTRADGMQTEDLHLSRRRALGAMIFTGYAAAALSAEAAPIVTDSAGLITDTVMIPTVGGPMPAYLARPSGAGANPTVLLASEIFGVHAYIQDVCRRWAKLGFVAIAPAFFFRAPGADKLPELTEFPAILKIVATANNAQVMGDVGATLAWLKAQPFVKTDALAIEGHCWGGGVVWMAAAQFKDFKAGAAWYGPLARPAAGAPVSDPTRKYPIEIAAELKFPVLGHYGGQDKGITAADVETMRQALKAAGMANSEIIVYPEAGHGFHADYRASYDATAATDGWKRMLAFFRAYGVATGATLAA
jgi:carboxymethylenebutenolidase